ncbi:peptidase domain-containing ABC transporter [Riemerella anatipestifer]|uniref:peptidase domain-containing ABC transporter n=1 Tax=Riemerella anatipestifer TaxID=34085 RepID=UPI001BDA3464|nr:peptidase domain-containing ABC transporter [Riemerella anatipestifer]MBT0551897.1 peptidase domain-containing ABC transporter [Riemerella anatipestifer]MBT0554019.1 peptidase domain-containing ABC transporter [Riemerella anatipestifer]MCE3024618.1 peptidase domain-containing ABC transporter [Riemerella anatipestifer]MCU7560291.1 peptidase domain-containing ABC transporter [Riemerella anatipestifer]MDY3449623.1 peptidase domain-containing ABC transporter [Riemerella anatipestifer]
MKKDTLIKQHDLKDCGAACLASVSAHYGLKMPIAKIRQLSHTDTRGTNVLGMVQGLEKMGFNAKGVKGGADALPEIPLPAIAHVITKEQYHHYVVIYKVKASKGGGIIEVMDPAFGKIEEYTLEEFSKIWTGVLILLEPNEYFEQKDEKTSLYRRFWNLVQPHKSILLQALVGAVVYTVLGLSTSIYIEKITDYVLIDGNRRLLNLLSVGMVVILLFQIFISAMKSILVLQTGQKMDKHLILGYYKHLLKLPQRFFDTMKVGEIISRVNDAVKIRAFINDVAIQIFVNIFIVIFSFALMFTYYWKLALIMALVIPFYFIIYWITNKLNKKVERKLMEESAELESHLVESITSVRTIKQFGVETFANNKTDNAFATLLKTIYKSVLNSLFSGNSSEFLSRIFTIILLWVGSGYVIDRTITPGELLSFYALIGYFTSPVSQLIGMNKTIQNALIAADRLFEIMDLEREETTEKMDITKEHLGDIQFKEVNFSYGSRVDVFEDFNCTIKKGKTTAIVGESGSGKTTLAALIQNLYPLKTGKILIGDYDINYISNYSLRSLISVVPQQIDLFSGNVIENIALGEDFPNVQNILNITKNLGILSFVEKLPNGFQTYLGENGALLSGGQKQRIAIARALYKNPEILILDEATSSLDTEAEQVIQNTLQEFRNQDKTMIVIAHRLSTIANADEILVMKEGKIIEQGTHNELISKDSVYKAMWEKQSINLN